MAEVGVRVVAPRVLRRVIRSERKLSGLGIHVPHARCWALSRDRLFSTVHPSDVGGELPEPEVVLVSAAALEDTPRGPTAALWQASFHARVHLAFEHKRAAGTLTSAVVRERVDRIGQTEFDEIRLVLRQDDLLPPKSDDIDVYAEFAATFLELRRFSPDRARRAFPTVADPLAVEAILALDVEEAILLEETRPNGAPPLEELVERDKEEEGERLAPAELSPLGPGDVARVRAEAEAARARGNVVRAARLLLSARLDATADLRSLGERLERALGPRGTTEVDAVRVKAWVDVLEPVAHAANAEGAIFRTADARLLYDLQKACVDAEREIHAVDVLTFVATFGRRPVVRALPAEREVRVARHLRNAASKVRRTHLSTEPKKQLARALKEARERSDRLTRSTLRPRIEAVLDEVGLQAHDLPEGVGRKKLVEELLDATVDRGFFGIGQLRDAISRNDVKLGDVTARELVFGDALLRADALLSERLDGVYRRGEIYLRWLQKLSSLAFGTRVGRALTLYLVLPIGASFVALEGLQHIVALFLPKPHGHGHGHAHAGPRVHLLTPVSLAVLSLVVFALLHSQTARDIGRTAVRALGTALHAVFVRAPLFVLSLPVVRALLGSRVTTFVSRVLLKPGVVAVIAYLFAHRLHARPWSALAIAGGGLLVANVVANSRWGMLAEEATIDWTVRRLRYLSRHFLPGLLALVLEVFTALVALIERGLYAVDERLLFKQGQSKLAMAGKALFGIFWAAATFLIRFYVNLLIEPQVNPIKHFPVVTVSHKIILPMAHTMYRGLISVLRPLGPIAKPLTGITILLLPGIFGFLVWELKENWKLYSASRKKVLQASVVGHHGETIEGLLCPGFHSGTVPKLYAKIRRSHAAHGKAHDLMHEVSHAVHRFVERDLVSVLDADEAFAGKLSVGEVVLGGNRLGFALRHEGFPAEASICFEEQSGWIVASVPRLGFLAELPTAARASFSRALGGFYKRAAVDLVREQIVALIGPSAYDVADEGLLVWPDDYHTEVVYDLHGGATLEPVVRGDARVSPRALDGHSLRFRDQPITWSRWVAAFSHGAVVVDGPPILG